MPLPDETILSERLLPGNSLISASQLGRPALEEILQFAEQLVPVASGAKLCSALRGALLANLFFEPSTRTRISFGAAFGRLGGTVLDTTGILSTSLSKGESLTDTARVVGGYVDVVVLRHATKNASSLFASTSPVPVINAGDGDGEHPTQALTDLYTIKQELARHGRGVDHARVAIIGDLRFGRTAHSLLLTLGRFEKLTFVLLSPPSLAMPQRYLDMARSHGHELLIASSLEEALDGADVIYVTRYQRERFLDDNGLPPEAESMFLNAARFARFAPDRAVIMHPLPRDSAVGELSTDLDVMSNLAIFRQTDNGVPVRMALFCKIFGLTAEQIMASMIEPGWPHRKHRSGDAAS